MNQEIKKIVVSSSLVAIAIAIDRLMKLAFSWLEMPFGGNFVGISMVPLVLIGFLCGLKYGLISGFVYGVVESILAPAGNIIGLSFLLDYYLGFIAFGFTGLFYKKLSDYQKVMTAILLVGLLRYIVVSLSGVMFFSQYAEGNVWFYSFIVYNLGYNVTTTLISLVIVLFSAKRLDAIAVEHLS